MTHKKGKYAHWLVYSLQSTDTKLSIDGVSKAKKCTAVRGFAKLKKSKKITGSGWLQNWVGGFSRLVTFGKNNYYYYY